MDLGSKEIKNDEYKKRNIDDDYLKSQLDEFKMTVILH